MLSLHVPKAISRQRGTNQAFRRWAEFLDPSPTRGQNLLRIPQLCELFSLSSYVGFSAARVPTTTQPKARLFFFFLNLTKLQ